MLEQTEFNTEQTEGNDSLVRFPRTSRHFTTTSAYVENHKETTCLCSKCGKVTTIYLECGDRTCYDCQQRRKKRMLKLYTPVVESMRHPLFLTLTLTRRPLRRIMQGEVEIENTVKDLRDYFTKLRHRKCWHASGGIYQIELGTIKDGTANLHLHVIVDASFLEKENLRSAWEDITEGSYVIDIELCWSPRGALGYLTEHMGKRIGKPGDADLINHCLHGTRLVQGFGNLSHMSLGLRSSICPNCGGKNTLYMDFGVSNYQYPAKVTGF